MGNDNSSSEHSPNRRNISPINRKISPLKNNIKNNVQIPKPTKILYLPHPHTLHTVHRNAADDRTDP